VPVKREPERYGAAELARLEKRLKTCRPFERYDLEFSYRLLALKSWYTHKKGPKPRGP
jgi:hypothetical protein